MKRKLHGIGLCLALAGLGWAQGGGWSQGASAAAAANARSDELRPRPNVLLILADDLGVDHVGWHPVGYATGAVAPTPVLSKLANGGISFTEAYAAPICGPTRACLLTGRHPFRHGLGDNPVKNRPQLPLAEHTLAEALGNVGYRTGAFGKWHVSFDRFDPNRQGFDHFDGTIAGLKGKSYYNWNRVINGVGFTETGYATTVVTDSAIGWIQSGGPGPWFAYVAYSAPHKPLEAPPLALDPVTQATPTDPPGVIYHGMIEAMDTEIGRLVAAVDLDRTLVLFFGDNGTAKSLVQGPVIASKAKHSIYEGGVRVPAFVIGATVGDSGRRDGLLHVVDVFRTVLDAAGAPKSPGPIDSVSLLSPKLTANQHWRPRRQYLFTERFSPSGRPPKGPFDELRRSVRGKRYKLIRTEAGDEFYDLFLDPWETFDLLNGALGPIQQSALIALDAKLESTVNN